MDAFLEMLPARLFQHPDGMIFEKAVGSGAPLVSVGTGPLVGQALRGMRQAAAAMAARQRLDR